MIIQRDTVGRIRRNKNGQYYFQTRFEDRTVVRARRGDWWTESALRALKRQQNSRPIGLLNLDELSWWMYRGKIYLTSGHPRPTEVANFLDALRIMANFSREPAFPEDTAFRFKTVGKRKPPGVPIAEITGPAAAQPPAASPTKKPRIPAREYIPERVKIFVWRRDGGQCVKCRSRNRLEFDHVIPVAKGGSNTARNLQLLCERCNRKKGTAIA